MIKDGVKNNDERLISEVDAECNLTDNEDLNIFEFEVEDIAFTAGEYRQLR